MSKKDFEFFWKTHLVTSSQGCHIPDQTLLYWHIGKEEITNIPWSRREGTARSHAVAAVAKDLMTQIRVANKKSAITATFLQNYSPCTLCVQEILKTVALAAEKRIKLEISIAFVALNGVRRPSWTWRGLQQATTQVSINESNDNANALRQLHENGVKISTFTPETWRFLSTFLGFGLPGRGRDLLGERQSSEQRWEEDKLMEADLRQVLTGVSLTSPSLSQSCSALDIEWSRPALPGDVTQYRVTCKKVLVMNREDEDIAWRIQQTVDTTGVKVVVTGELSSLRVTDLEFDTFYDVTVEAMVKGMVTCCGRKILRTGSKAVIPSLQTPTMSRKLGTSTRPRTASIVSCYTPIMSDSPVRLRRSNSIQTTSSSQAAESNHIPGPSCLSAPPRRPLSSSSTRSSSVEGDYQPRPSSTAPVQTPTLLRRVSSDRPASTTSVEIRRRISDIGGITRRVITTISGKGNSGSGHKKGNSGLNSTVL